MSALKRILGFVLVATAAVVGINWVITLIYHDSSSYYPVWQVVNWLMGLSALVALIVNIARKRAVGNGAPDSQITREYLEANAAFYASLLLAPWFFTNFLAYNFFLDNLLAAAVTSKDVTSKDVWREFIDDLFVLAMEIPLLNRLVLRWWEFINGLFVLAIGSTGCHLWRSASDSHG